MSLALHQPSEPAPRGADWIDTQTAAERSGMNVGHVNRLCGERWLAEGKARTQKPPGGGKPRWFVREDADPAFARVLTPEQLTDRFDIRTLPEAHRKLVLERQKILRDWQTSLAGGVKLGFSARQVTAQFLQQLELEQNLPVSPRTLYNWLSGYRQQGLAGLLDKRRERDGAEKSDDPFLAEVRRLFLDQRRKKLIVCWEIACAKAEEQGWKVHSYKTAQRFIAAIPKPVVLKLRFGEEAFVNEAEPYIERDYSKIAANDLWNADHHQFDVWVENGHDAHGAVRHVRPWLTAWQDARSRKITGWVIRVEPPNTEAILLSLRRAVRSHGVPKHVHVDNGKDFDSFALHGRTKRQRRKKDYDPDRIAGVFNVLGIEARNVQPYHGQSKPIERFFGTLEDRFGRTFPTYCGNSPDNRPEDLQAKLASGQAPTLDELAGKFEEWLESDYHQRPHHGDAMDGRTPAAVFEQLLSVKRTADERTLDIYCMAQAKAKVGQNGVRYRGILYGKDLAQLTRDRLGQEVRLHVESERPAQVHVFDLAGNFVATAAANVRLSPLADSSDVSEAQRLKRRARKVEQEYHRIKPHLAEDLTDTATRVAAARHRQRKAASPTSPSPSPGPSLQPVRSPLEDQFPALQRAMQQQELRVAVGAESASVSLAEVRQAMQPAPKPSKQTNSFAALSSALRGSQTQGPRT